MTLNGSTSLIGEARYYAVRRVNPFEGVLQIVETALGRAYSPNGTVWQVQVLAQRPDHTWRSASEVPPIEQFFNFGRWDADRGLQKIPANPVMDIGAMTSAADEVCQTLGEFLDLLPFPLFDRFECWSTDHRGDPIALLASCEDPDLIDEIRVSCWRATHGSAAPSPTTRVAPSRDATGPWPRAEQLENLMRQTGRQERWFERRDDGLGVPLRPADEGTPLAEDRFPRLGLKTDWDRADDRELVADYIDWLAPRLLTLQHLPDRERQALEQAACRRAEELAAVYRLLPRILDRQAMETARVEARLRQAGQRRT